MKQAGMYTQYNVCKPTSMKRGSMARHSLRGITHRLQRTPARAPSHRARASAEVEAVMSVTESAPREISSSLLR